MWRSPTILPPSRLERRLFRQTERNRGPTVHETKYLANRKSRKTHLVRLANLRRQLSFYRTSLSFSPLSPPSDVSCPSHTRIRAPSRPIQERYLFLLFARQLAHSLARARQQSVCAHAHPPLPSHCYTAAQSWSTSAKPSAAGSGHASCGLLSL